MNTLIKFSVASIALFFIQLTSAESKTIYLSCSSENVTTIDGIEYKPPRMSFDLTIKDEKDELSITTNNNLGGAGITFHSKSKRYINIKDYSDESHWSFKYDVQQPDGSIFSHVKFDLNRFTGSLTIDEIIGNDHLEGRGKCDSQNVKKF